MATLDKKIDEDLEKWDKKEEKIQKEIDNLVNGFFLDSKLVKSENF